GISWGNIEDVRGHIGKQVSTLEAAGLSNFAPGPMASLRKFVGREDVPLAEFAAAASQLGYLGNAFKVVNGNGSVPTNGLTPDRRLSRVTGQIRPSLLPLSMKLEPLSSAVTAYGKSAEMTDVPTKHVRSAILFTDFSQFSKQSKGAKSQYIIDRLNRYFE